MNIKRTAIYFLGAVLCTMGSALAQQTGASDSNQQSASPAIGFGSGTGMGSGGGIGSPGSVVGGLGSSLGAPGSSTQTFGGGFTPQQFGGPVPPLGIQPGGAAGSGRVGVGGAGGAGGAMGPQ